MNKQIARLLILQLLLFGNDALVTASVVDTVAVYSKSMNKTIKTVVITPQKYYAQAAVKYPVVYLLHGHSGNYKSWIQDVPSIIKAADELGMIIVCPDGGFNSWYINSPVDSLVKYDTYIAKELVPYIDSNYATITDKKARAISGYSMGGHGALYLAIKHPDLFANVGSICGGVNLRPFPNHWQLKNILGELQSNTANWDNYSVINVVDALTKGQLNMMIDCGVDDFFLKVNRQLHEKLVAMKIPHEYIERDGGHNRNYWANSIDYHFFYFKRMFAREGY
ncbi:MAG: alpha/beta hydrolase [Bacteroidota bacterium]